MATERRQLFATGFDQANGVIGAPNWTALSGYSPHVVVSQELTSADVFAITAYSQLLPKDHWAECVVTDPMSGTDDLRSQGITVRSDAALGCYAFLQTINGFYITFYDYVLNDSFFQGGVDWTVNPGDVMRAEARNIDGTETVKGFINDTEVLSIEVTGRGLEISGTVGLMSYKPEVPHETGTIDDFAAGDWVEAAGEFTVTGVNANNTILSNGPINVFGTGLEDTTTCKILGSITYDLNIQAGSVQYGQFSCDPFDIFASDLAFGGAQVEVGNGAITGTQAITLDVESGWQYITGGDDIDTNTGLAQGGGAIGDQWAIPVTVGPSSTVLYPDTNFKLDSPVATGTVFTYQLYTASQWGASTVTINQQSTVGAAWDSPITAPSITVGVRLSGTFASAASGSPPLSFSEVIKEAPQTLVFRTDGSYNGLVPSSDSFDIQMEVSNYVSPDGELSNIVSVNPQMPTISNPRDRSPSNDGAQITLTTPAEIGAIYWIADASSSQPDGDQIYFGLNAAGTPAELHGSFNIDDSGEQPWLTIGGGQPGKKYFYWFTQVN